MRGAPVIHSAGTVGQNSDGRCESIDESRTAVVEHLIENTSSEVLTFLLAPVIIVLVDHGFAHVVALAQDRFGNFCVQHR